MKVIHVFNEIRFSGAEVMYARAASRFRERGIDLVAVSTGKEIGDYAAELVEAGFQVHHREVPKGALSRLRYASDFIAYLRTCGDCLLHVHSSKNLTLFAVCAWLARVPMVRTVHSVFRHRWFTRPKGMLERRFAAALGVVFHSIGQAVCENERRYYANPSVVINNWVDDRRFSAINVAARLEARTELRIERTSKVVISVGGCSEIKSHDHILKAITNLDVVYLHLGSGSLQRAEVELAESLGILSRVRFVGNVEDVRPYLAAADVYLMPSKLEGLGNAALEAMCSGLPCIFYNVPGLRELADGGRAALLVQPAPDALREAIVKVLEEPALRNSLGESAKILARTEYGLSGQVEKIVSLYKRVWLNKCATRDYSL